MKKIWLYIIVFLSFTQLPLTAQIIQPLKLQTEVKKVADDTFDLIIKGTLEPGWHLYSQFSDPDGSSPLKLTWKNAGKDYEPVGETVEKGTHRAYNDIFGVTETFWSDKVLMIQRIKLKNSATKQISVHLEGQACKEACILVNEDLIFDLTPYLKKSPATTKTTTEKTNKTRTVKDEKTSGTPGKQENSVTETPSANLQENSTQNKNNTDDNQDGKIQNKLAGKTTNATASSVKQKVEIEDHGKKSLWWIFLMSILGGFLALLMPCIYPMIPLTISFFTKQSEKTGGGKFNALAYGFFIVAIFVLLSVPFHFLDNIDANIFNKISTDPWLNLLFFVIFFIFGLSFLGVSSLDPQRLIPSKWISKSDEYSHKSGGLVAIFFMALTLILVSFSCTGPILGALLGSVAFGGAMALTVGMLGFGIGLAAPFTLFALFPSLLKTMPQSGGWLNTLKVSLGFIELALAFKFLSNTDLVLQLHLLERETFLAIWIAIFTALAFYLFGFFKTPYDDDSDRISVIRLLFAMLFLSFSIYMLPGLWGAPLKWISAFPPYLEYSESPHGVGYSKTQTFHAATNSAALPEGAKILHGGLTVFNDYDKGMAYAKQINKPVMLDFTGFACVNCRKMENNVWTDPEVHQILKDSLIIISLYVDDKRELPENEQYVSGYSGKKIVLAGDKWAEMQIYKYKSNSQPYYVLLSPGGEILNQPVAYTDKDTYLNWLLEGLQNLK
jgi:thiol:disulfide interchange protein DsbD